MSTSFSEIDLRRAMSFPRLGVNKPPVQAGKEQVKNT